ncbi:unnamed protein product [Candidula unifasciata]|uniref:NWD1/2-like winged helix-turn-helix domain-containing protein n=1 Tax=Candidula unifasciata TaxID=100452 RepID=A0A8S3YLS8_9EUPU|nr:unnamed protein product [Candidula unifasciata]
MRDAFYVKASSWDTQGLLDVFTSRMNMKKRTLTEPQNESVMAAITQCPLPMYATSTAKIACTWGALTEVKEDDLPSSLEGIVNKLFDHLERCIPPNCFSAMMSYITLSIGGISKWEMADLISVNDSVLTSIYSDVKHPPIHRAPPILWKLITFYLRNHLNMFLSMRFYTYSWTSNSFRKLAALRYAVSATASKKLHTEMCDYFLGRWACKKISGSGAEGEKRHLQERFVMPQPDAFGKHLNVRKFMCLPFHVMHASSKHAHTLETYIFNLPWVEKKLDSTSVPQVVCDLEHAKLLDSICSGKIKALQQAVLQSFCVLQVQGRQIYKCLQHLMTYTSEPNDHDDKSQSKSNNGLTKLLAWFSRPPVPLLHTLDCSNVSLSQISNSSTSVPFVDAIVPVSNDVHEAHIIYTLSSQNEIRVINVVTNQVVRTLRGVDAPKHVIMLDSTRAVVLCNRELAVIDLDRGVLLMKLRGVLNLRMPFFGLQCDQKVVALSRDRMVVNILDISTGGIVATFKAGETRFLDSLIISGDGKILVCGDETQKPFPLLVWSLEQSKLLHDIRMPQHEFITQHADITHNGQYLACLCREITDSTSNFVVVYDLVSGHLFKKFKMNGACTTVSLASKTMSVIVALDTGQLAVWDLVLGSHKFLIDGAPVAINNIRLTPDESMCLTTHREDSSISSHTLSLWNLNAGHFEACHTFDCPITCAQFTPDGHMILAGIKGHPYPIRLLYVPEGKDLTITKAQWEKEKDAANAVFGDVSRKELVINMAMEAT